MKKQMRIIPKYGCSRIIPRRGINECSHKQNEAGICTASQCPLFTKIPEMWVWENEQ